MRILIAVFCFIIIYSAQSVIYKKFWKKGLGLELFFTENYLEAGGSSYITEIVTNQKRLPLTALHIKFSTSRTLRFEENENASVTDLYHRSDAFSVAAYQKVTRNLKFTAENRGLFFITSVKLMANDFLMARTYAEPLENHSFLYVFPKRLKQMELNAVLNGILGDMESKRSLLPDPYAVKGIRSYSSGDSRKSINWKMTARYDNLMVNVYSHTAEEKVKILVCLEPNAMIKTEYMMEMCISMASTAAAFFIRNRIPVMVETNGLDRISGMVESVPYGASKDHLFSIDKYLARIEENSGLDNFLRLIDKELEKKDTHTSYLVLSAYRKEDLLKKLDAMAADGKSVCMISPYLDIQGFDKTREYLHGMEVVLNDT